MIYGIELSNLIVPALFFGAICFAVWCIIKGTMR